jgi:hypothetical protein
MLQLVAVYISRCLRLVLLPAPWPAFALPRPSTTPTTNSSTTHPPHPIYTHQHTHTHTPPPTPALKTREPPPCHDSLGCRRRPHHRRTSRAARTTGSPQRVPPVPLRLVLPAAQCELSFSFSPRPALNPSCAFVFVFSALFHPSWPSRPSALFPPPTSRCYLRHTIWRSDLRLHAQGQPSQC